jgi:hypothetical protein
LAQNIFLPFRRAKVKNNMGTRAHQVHEPNPNPSFLFPAESCSFHHQDAQLAR